MFARRMPALLLAVLSAACARPVWHPIAPLDAIDTDARADRAYVWSFDRQEAVGLLALQGHWSVERDPFTRTPGFLLRSEPVGEADAYSHIIVSPIRFADADVGVRCRAAADGVCGLTFRVTDGEHFYALRANDRNRQLSLFRVAVSWLPIAEVDLPSVRDGWHRLEVHSRGAEVRARWDGREVLMAHDDALPSLGAVGLLADPAAITDYDDFAAHAL